MYNYKDKIDRENIIKRLEENRIPYKFDVTKSSGI